MGSFRVVPLNRWVACMGIRKVLKTQDVFRFEAVVLFKLTFCWYFSRSELCYFTLLCIKNVISVYTACICYFPLKSVVWITFVGYGFRNTQLLRQLWLVVFTDVFHSIFHRCFSLNLPLFHSIFYHTFHRIWYSYFLKVPKILRYCAKDSTILRRFLNVPKFNNIGWGLKKLVHLKIHT